jgi:hypothetical protein
MAVRVTVYGTADMKQIERARYELDRLAAAATSKSATFTGAMSRLGTAASNTGKKISGLGDSMTRNLTTPLLAAGAGLLWAAKGAEKAEIANRKLDNVLKSMDYGDATARVSAYAESLERTIAVDADVIKATQTKLATFANLTKTVNEAGGAFDRATMAALDLAAAGFGSAESNAVALGKALQDPIKGIAALARSGVTFTAQEKEKIKTLVESGRLLESQEMILAAIEKQVGGTAAAGASSFEKIKLSLMATADEIGVSVLPMIEKFTSILTSDILPKAAVMINQVTAAFNGLSPEMQSVVVGAITITAVLGPLLSIVGRVATGIGALANGFVGVSNAAGRAYGGLQNFVTGLTNASAGSSAFATPMMKLGGHIRTAALAVGSFTKELALNVVAQARSAATWVATTAAMVAHKAALVAGTIATGLATAAQWALNVAMSANPIMLIVLAITALVAGLVWFFTQTELGKQIWSGFVAWLTNLWNGVASFFSNLWNWIVNAWNGAVAAIGQGIMAVGQFFLNLPGNILKFLQQAIPAVWNFFTSLPGKIVEFIATNAPKIWNWFTSLPGKAIAAIGDIGKWFGDLGGDIIDGLITGLGNAAGAVGQWFSDIGAAWVDQFKGIFGIKSPSRVFAAIGGNITQGLANGLAAGAPAVTNALDALGTNAIETGVAATMNVQPLMAAAASGSASPAFGATNTTSSLSSIVIAEGAVQVTISGNADAGTFTSAMNDAFAGLVRELRSA